MPTLLATIVLAVMALAVAAQAAAEPTSIEEKRAQVARIEGELAAIDAQVGRAAEEYNGAQYRLGIVMQRIDENRLVLNKAQRNLARARSILTQRVRDIYRQGEPSLAEVLLGSRSVVAAVDQVDMLARVGKQDAAVVSDIKAAKLRAQTTRARLLVDRKQSKQEVAAAKRHKAKVEGLLRRRQQVLSQVKGDLARMLAAERARQARIAEAARQRALAAQRAAEAAARATVSPTVAPSDPSNPTAPVPTGEGNAQVVSIAMGYLGTPYVWGGAAPGGFDCSGLASFCYGQIGKSVPHYTVAIYNAFPKVPYDQLQPGDLVFFNGLSHMGIYIGGGQMVHAPHTGDVVRVASISRGDYVGAVRP